MWRQLEGYSRYEISSEGLVRNINTNKLIKGSLSQDYICISLYPDSGKVKPLRLHRVVATLFCERKRKEDDVVNHLDGNKLNNNANNLEWTTVRENTIHALKFTKRHKRGERPVKRICLKTGNVKIYKSVLEAQEDNSSGIKDPTYIYDTCRKKRNTSGGYKWEYVKDEYPMDGKEINGFSRYLITPDGKIFNKLKNIYLKPYINNGGYHIIDLHGSETKKEFNYTRQRHARRKKFRVHRLVAEHFIPNPNPEKLKEVNHKNKIRTDNRVENLEWVTSEQNLGHAHNKTVYQFDSKWNFIAKYISLKEASINTSIDYKNISACLRKGYPHKAGGYYWTFTKPIKSYENGIFYILLLD